MDIEAIARAIDPRATRSGDQFKVKCPSHEDAHASASIKLSQDGRLLVRCHAGCAQSAVWDAVRSLAGHLMERPAERQQARSVAPAQPQRQPRAEIQYAPLDVAPPDFSAMRINASEFTRSWEYRSADDRLVGFVARFDGEQGKTIRPIIWDGHRWKMGGFPEPRPLFNAPRVAHTDDALIIVEGEKAAEILQQHVPSATVTTWQGGASAALRAGWDIVRNRRVVIWPDADEPGFRAAQLIGEALIEQGCSVRYVVPPEDVESGWDAADAIAQSIEPLAFIRSHLALLLPPRYADTSPAPLPEAREESTDFLIFTQEEIARYFVSTVRENARHWSSADKWYFYDDSIWVEDRTLRTVSIATEIAKRLAQRALDDHPKQGEKIARSMLTSGAIHGGVRIARSDQTIQIDGTKFNTKPHLICTPGGTFDANAGLFRESKREDYSTFRTRVTPEFSSRPRAWLRFLLQIFGGNRRVARFVRHALAYALTGHTHIHALFFFHGHGRNGKSTLAEIFQYIAGDYAHVATHDFLMSSGSDKHPTELAALVGKRAVMCSEIGEGARWNDVRIKELTGSSHVRARFMRQDGFEFERVAKIFVLGNTRPTFAHIDPALEARIKLIPFDVSFAGREDFALSDRLREEAPAILADLLNCAARVTRHGLPRCREIELASDEYLREMDDIANFMSDCCEPYPFHDGASTAAAELHAAFNIWRRDRQQSPLSDKRFFERMRTRFPMKRAAKFRAYVGVALTRDKALDVRRYLQRQREQRSPRVDYDNALLSAGIDPES